MRHVTMTIDGGLTANLHRRLPAGSRKNLSEAEAQFYVQVEEATIAAKLARR